MKKYLVRALPLALAAAVIVSVHGAAQTDAPRQGRGYRNPVTTLVDSAQALALTDSQVVQLRAIATQLDSTNAPTIAELQKLRPAGAQGGMGGGGMAGGGQEMTPEQRQRFEQMRPLMQQLRQNSMAALMQAYALLTPDQQQKAQAMMPARRGMGGGSGGPPPQP